MLHACTVRDPSVKRTLCKGCDTVLVPGLSATVRVNSARVFLQPSSYSCARVADWPHLGSNAHRHVIITSCLRCKVPRRIPAPPVPNASPTAPEDIVMEVDKVEGSAPRKSKRRRGPPPRPPPLFEREGHVIIRGNVQIEPKND
jgi:ribonuclease P protein subunit RPR2